MASINFFRFTQPCIPADAFGAADFERNTSIMIRLFIGLLMTVTIQTSAIAQVWATAISKNESAGTAIVFRYIKEFAPAFVRGEQPIRIIITWNYEGAKGMPNAETNGRMIELEDVLDPAVSADALSTLSLVSTGNGLKEWIYYTKSEAEFFARLNAVLGPLAAFPIEIHVAEDPTWKSYETFRNGVRE
jgi:hypothetical protein